MVIEVSGIPELLPCDVDHMTLCPQGKATDSGHATSHLSPHAEATKDTTKQMRIVAVFHRSFSESSATSLSAKLPSFQCCRFL